MEVKVHSFLTSAVGGVVWQGHGPAALHPGNSDGIHTGGQADPRTCLDGCGD
jgi:hypothetical protein